MQGPWWRSFRDPILDLLVEETLYKNFSLKQAMARIKQARAVRRLSGAQLGPELLGFSSASGGWQEESQRSRNIELGFDLSWEMDVWGRLAAIENSDRLEAVATEYDLAALRLLLSGEVAETYFRLLEQALTIELLDRQIEASESNLDFIQYSFGYGQSPSVDVLQQREQLASVRAQKPRPESDLRVFQHRLAVLVGSFPTGGTMEGVFDYPEVDSDLAVGVPSEVLMERPDLRSEAARLASVDRRIAAAIADCYPRVRIGGDAGRRSTVNPSTLFANALMDAAGPIFDSGRRQSVVDLRRAEFEERLARFDQVFLQAVEEVENALWREHHQRELIEALEEQLRTGENLLTESRAQYAQGASSSRGASSDYLSVLGALQSVQRIEREVLSRRRELLSVRVQLHLAIGGPMEPAARGPS